MGLPRRFGDRRSRPARGGLGKGPAATRGPRGSNGARERGGTTAWVKLIAAGLLEVVWAIALKKSGLSLRSPGTLVFALAAAGSLWLLADALKSLPVGTGYAIWTGIGAVGAALVGVAWLGEPAPASRLAAIATITGGLVWLALVSES